jgi:hypothetical protein
MSSPAQTIRSARWLRLQAIISAASVPYQRDGSYALRGVHPDGWNAGYLELRVSTSQDGFVRARVIGPWPGPLEPGRVEWARTLVEADVTECAVEYARTGGHP